MSETRTPEQERMQRLLELQTKLRELTEAKKAMWRRQGEGPSETPRAPLEAPAAAAPEPEVESAAPAQPSESKAQTTGPAVQPDEPAVHPAEPPAQPTFTAEPPPPSLEPAVAPAAERPSAAVAEGMGVSSRWRRRRGQAARTGGAAGDGALRRTVRQVTEVALSINRLAAARARDLTGGLGGRGAKRKPRPGDPITPKELIDDRTLGAKVLGAAVFLVGLAVLGGVILVQMGKVDVPQLEGGSLPAATSPSSPFASLAPASADEEGDEGATSASLSGESAALDEGSGSAEASRSGVPLGTGPIGSAPRGGTDNASAGEAATSDLTDPGEAFSPEVLEFTRLQGDLAFRMGEYEIVRAEFEQGMADCTALTDRFEGVDRAHLLLSRRVARWRSPPAKQAAAYEELSTILDELLEHYAASGCGPDAGRLP